MIDVRTVAARAALLLPLTLTTLPAAAQLPLQRELPASPGQTLDVEMDAGGALHVVGSERNSVVVRVEEGSRPCKPACRAEVAANGEGVRVHTFHEEQSRSRTSSLRVTVEVPQSFNLKLRSNGGAIDIDNVSGKIAGRTMGGALSFSRLAGDVDFTTMGGAISVKDSRVDGRVHTMGGAVVLDNVTGGLQGTSMGGKVTRRGATQSAEAGAQREVRIRTMGGDIKVDAAPRGADVQTMGGGIRIRSAADHVRARTMGGDVVLEEVDGSVRATTMGGNVKVRMVGDPARGDRRVEITSMGGNIELVVPAELSMDVDVELAFTRGHEGSYRITSDFPLEQTVSQEWERRGGSPRKYIRAKGKVGDGKNPIKIRTVDGNVRLIRGR